jgi:hypothetical protein
MVNKDVVVPGRMRRKIANSHLTNALYLKYPPPPQPPPPIFRIPYFCRCCEV